MTTLDTTLPAEVIAVLAEYGKAVTITAYADSYDPATGINSQTPTNHSVTSAPPYAYERRFVNGDTVQEGDLRLLIEATAAGFVPAVGNKVAFDSRVMHLVSVSPIYSGANVIAYELQARGDG